MPRDLFNSTDNDVDKRMYHVIFEKSFMTMSAMDFIEDVLPKDYPRCNAAIMYQYEPGMIELVGYDSLPNLVKWESGTDRWAYHHPWSPLIGKPQYTESDK